MTGTPHGDGHDDPRVARAHAALAAAPDLAQRCTAPLPDLALAGIAHFNRREYFACHEALEAAWNAEPHPVRALYKGILQVGVSCYHLLRGNYRGATLKLRTGAAYLDAFAPACMGVDVAALIADARALLATVEALGPDRFLTLDLSRLPTVRLVEPAAESFGPL